MVSWTFTPAVDELLDNMGIFIDIPGVIIEGHHVASQPSRDYPYAALERQIPHFKIRGLNLDRYYPGTLNVSIAPRRFVMLAPEYTFPLVDWTELHPPETFSFSCCKIQFKEKQYEGMVYYPHPETKIRHFQDPSVIEVLAEYIPGIDYGGKVELSLNPEEIKITD